MTKGKGHADTSASNRGQCWTEEADDIFLSGLEENQRLGKNKYAGLEGLMGRTNQSLRLRLKALKESSPRAQAWFQREQQRTRATASASQSKAQSKPRTKRASKGKALMSGGEVQAVDEEHNDGEWSSATNRDPSSSGRASSTSMENNGGSSSRAGGLSSSAGPSDDDDDDGSGDYLEENQGYEGMDYTMDEATPTVPRIDTPAPWTRRDVERHLPLRTIGGLTPESIGVSPHTLDTAATALGLLGMFRGHESLPAEHEIPGILRSWEASTPNHHRGWHTQDGFTTINEPKRWKGKGRAAV